MRRWTKVPGPACAAEHVVTRRPPSYGDEKTEGRSTSSATAAERIPVRTARRALFKIKPRFVLTTLYVLFFWATGERRHPSGWLTQKTQIKMYSEDGGLSDTFCNLIDTASHDVKRSIWAVFWVIECLGKSMLPSIIWPVAVALSSL